ncbi:ATP-binding protein [Sphaerotilus sp.]|uniref:sensor histidine kinase n=1 Tax=Sphaerotilus sp. TaxID=2093942 RepID=UPI0034E19AC3
MKPDTASPPPRTAWRREFRVLALRLLPWVVVVCVAGALSYLRLLDLRLTPLRNGARLLIEQSVAITTSELSNLSRDALVLGQNPALTTAVSGDNLSAIGTALLTFARASRPYARIAWVDGAGHERSRIENDDGIATLIDPARLRHSAPSPWLKSLSDLLPTEARFTQLDDHDGGVWLHAASPVYDGRGRQRGMVVLTLDMRRLLAQLQALDSAGIQPIQLVGPDGRVVEAGAATPGLPFTDPELWQLMQEQGRGRREGPEGMWHFQDFLPTEPGPGRLASAPWHFIAHVPAETVRLLRSMSAWQSGGASALVLVLAAWATGRRRQIERERERLLADLQSNHRALATAKAEAEAALQRLQQLQTELVQAEKLASLGLLVAGVAHELNTPLGSAKVTASTMSRRLDDALRSAMTDTLTLQQMRTVLDNQRTGLDIVDHSLSRAGQVIVLFKQLAVDRGAVERRVFALDDLLSDVRRLLNARQMAPDVALYIEPVPGLMLDSYPGPLGQVVENLVGNAQLHAFDPDAGPRPPHAAPAEIRVCSQIDPHSGCLEITVIDNGSGIDASVLPRIFDPFFTTRRGRGGTGIGLHLCHHFCTQVLGGRVTVATSPGQGSRFMVQIPLRAP